MEIFNEQIGLRMANNRKVLQRARDKMDTLVNGEREPGRDSQETVSMDRRLPDRALTLKDLLVFVLQCLNVRDMAYIAFISLAVTLIGMYTPYVTKQIYDEIIPAGTPSDLLPVFGLLIGAGIGAMLFGVTRSLMLMFLRYKVDASLQAAVMARTFNLRTEFFRRYPAGDLENRVMAVTEISNQMSDTLLSDFLTVMFSVGYFIQIFNYAPSLMGVSLLVMGSNLLLIVILYFWQVRLNSIYIPRASELSGLQLSVISGVQKIRTSGSEVRAFAKVAEKYADSVIPIDRNFPARYGSALSTLVGAGGMLLIYIYGVAGKVQLSDFMAYMAAYGAASGAVGVLGGLLPKLANLKPLIELARPVLEAQPDTAEDAPPAGTLSGRIEIHNLSFRYSDDAPYVLKNLNLTINPGEYVAIVGKSGCGKSTLVRLLLGFEQPEAGSIFYDTYDLARTQKQSVRRQIGTCLQDGQLFSGSLFENISITKPTATQSEAWEAAAIAALDDDIQDMPMGMHTLLSENGGTLSGGQRQRVLIARAVIGKPSIIIMDEATSALDNLKQKRVADNLDRMHSTRVCIAHRLSTIMHCDRIIVLDKGSVAEEGTFQQLMDRRGLFYELSRRQM